MELMTLAYNALIKSSVRLILVGGYDADFHGEAYKGILLVLIGASVELCQRHHLR